jgi:hypothetical protein
MDGGAITAKGLDRFTSKKYFQAVRGPGLKQLVDANYFENSFAELLQAGAPFPFTVGRGLSLAGRNLISSNGAANAESLNDPRTAEFRGHNT